MNQTRKPDPNIPLGDKTLDGAIFQFPLLIVNLNYKIMSLENLGSPGIKL